MEVIEKKKFKKAWEGGDIHKNTTAMSKHNQSANQKKKSMDKGHISELARYG